MNASSRKVLRKVLLGFIIMEPNRRKGRIRRRSRCPKTKMVLGRSGLSFRCHDATNRERERERIRKAPITIYQNIKNWRYVYMKMHEHVTCKFKCIMGSTQSKPTSTQHSNKVNTHLKCMKHCYNANVMQCTNI